MQPIPVKTKVQLIMSLRWNGKSKVQLMILAKGNVQLISVKNKVQLILLLRQKAMMWRRQEDDATTAGDGHTDG